MSSTIQLKTTIQRTSRFIYNSPLLYVNDGSVGYSIGNDVRQFILSPPFTWRWNRNSVAPITCQAGQSDYSVNIPDFGFIERAWVTYPITGGNSMNILTATRSGGTVTLQVNGNPVLFGFQGGQTITVGNVSDPTYDGFQSFQISSITVNTIVYSQSGANSTATGGVVVNYSSNNTNPQITQELTVSETLAQSTMLGQPGFISVINDDNNGNITFRLLAPPDQNYILNIIYQKAAPIFQNVTDTWAPIPDYLSYLYNAGMLAKGYEFKGDERFGFAWQAFLKLVIGAADGLTDTQRNIYLEPRIITAREQSGAQITGNQAKAGRGGA